MGPSRLPPLSSTACSPGNRPVRALISRSSARPPADVLGSSGLVPREGDLPTSPSARRDARGRRRCGGSAGLHSDRMPRHPRWSLRPTRPAATATPTSARPSRRPRPHVAAGLGAFAVGAAVVVAFVTRDLATAGAPSPAPERLIHLLSNYDCPWPRVFHHRVLLFGFGAVAAAVACSPSGRVGLALRRPRGRGARGPLRRVGGSTCTWCG